MENDAECRIPSLPEKLVAALFFLPGLFIAIVLLFPIFLRPNPVYALNFELAGLALAVLCLSGIVAGLFGWKATGVLVVAVLALYWVAVGAACFFILLNPAFVLLYYGLYYGVPAFLIVGLCTAYARRGLKRSWWSRSVVGGFSCGFVIVLVLSAHANKQTADQTTPWPPPTQPFVLGEDLVQLVKCSRQFAALHPELGYPETPSEMGPNGTGCLPEALVTGNYKGFSISYHPGTRNAHGTIDNFSINAEQAAPHGLDFSTMSTDESGLVVYKYEGPRGKGIPFSYSSSAEGAIETLLRCLWSARSDSWSGMPRADQQAQQSFQECVGDKYVSKNDRNGEIGLYTFAYAFDQNGFTCEVRPRTYGIGGIRSYLVVGKYSALRSESGLVSVTRSLRVHGTPEDRSATLSDPLANICEIQCSACVGPAQMDY